MRPLIAALLFIAVFDLSAAPKPKVKLTTSMGVIVMELEPEVAPKTVENFLKYVKKGQYKGTIFHRVISGFMIQGGGYVDYLGKKRTDAAIPNEADRSAAAGLKNKRGTLAMARTADPHSAAAEFFINVVDNPFLDFKGKANDKTWGYCVFGKVTQGMDVVDRIKAVKTSNKRSDFPSLPVKPVLITDAVQLP
ncbi:MAG: peptidyl-prolyl cis-trans isomerase [Geothrix sp.]|uniref:peptidylprolyl isomerase n=1 Tax=Geothrix sp. TaxID=1962974 RepID=UPI00179EA658|nr:peptidylprolyl isomerase [Geothrix sp.]NWJ39729.1 peptidyl-prolyl cis-trans isomerase [Geothrix sp.]WIL22256.1 MAG: peptidylprolyl isomerase [Geothrix sp.]